MTKHEWPESFLAHVWSEQRLRSPLVARSGKIVQVHFAGHHNTMAGPDFRFALLDIDGQAVRGDVELHHRPGDWQAHRHHTDSGYNRVVLHCVFEGGKSDQTTVREDGGRVDIVDLEPNLHEALSLMLRRWKRRKRPISDPRCSLVADWTPARKRALLRQAGHERLERKVHRFGVELAFADWDQLLYQGLFEALGYSANKLAMYDLAQAIPWRVVSEWKGIDASTLASVWMGAAGLLHHLPRKVPGALATRWRDAYVRQDYCRRQVYIEWRSFRQRAVNHPAVRLAQAATALRPALGRSLFRRFLELFSLPVGKLTPERLRQSLATVFHCDDLPDGLRIGRDRLDAFAVNILVPQALLYARKQGYSELEEAVYSLWETYPRMATNQPLRRFEKLWAVRCKTALEQQGALRLWRLYCNEHRCDVCDNHLVKE
ncbi:MAG: DUF2851 family protein [Candidatus Cloacimonetes bacterium]|nr:DUF2851 family protein [Candidatus Cloacimonadota bacterium]